MEKEKEAAAARAESSGCEARHEQDGARRICLRMTRVICFPLLCTDRSRAGHMSLLSGGGAVTRWLYTHGSLLVQKSVC